MVDITFPRHSHAAALIVGKESKLDFYSHKGYQLAIFI
jgi:hypothetical protein